MSSAGLQPTVGGRGACSCSHRSPEKASSQDHPPQASFLSGSREWGAPEELRARTLHAVPTGPALLPGHPQPARHSAARSLARLPGPRCRHMNSPLTLPGHSESSHPTTRHVTQDARGCRAPWAAVTGAPGGHCGPGAQGAGRPAQAQRTALIFPFPWLHSNSQCTPTGGWEAITAPRKCTAEMLSSPNPDL